MVMAMLLKSMKKYQKRFSHIFILFLIGIFVSAQQVSSESVFDHGNNLSLHESKLAAPDFGTASPAGYTNASADTVEIYDIDVYEEKDRNIYKEVVLYTLVVAAVGYFVYTLIKPEENEPVDEGGKEPPITPSISFSIPLSR